jgi:hypothetical protein
MIEKLWLIGSLKRAVPLGYRSRVSQTGLYVQLRFAGDAGRLEAGGRLKHTLSVWFNQDSEIPSGHRSYRIQKVDAYNPGEWERLIQPALEVAAWVYLWWNGELKDPKIDDRLEAAVAGLKRSGTWTFLTPEEEACGPPTGR